MRISPDRARRVACSACLSDSRIFLCGRVHQREFAPPVLPVYVQPPCPQPGWMWTPGYWAYGPDGYYWVPGTWVPAPYVGALWTPGYWGWNAACMSGIPATGDRTWATTAA